MTKQIFEIRGHHIRHLRDYLRSKTYSFFDDLIIEDIVMKYGQEFFNNRKNVLEEISKGNSLVKIIAKQDNLCDKCKFKVKEGCLIEGEFIKKKDSEDADIQDIDLFRLELNRVYSGKEIAALLIA